MAESLMVGCCNVLGNSITHKRQRPGRQAGQHSRDSSNTGALMLAIGKPTVGARKHVIDLMQVGTAAVARQRAAVSEPSAMAGCLQVDNLAWRQMRDWWTPVQCSQPVDTRSGQCMQNTEKHRKASRSSTPIPNTATESPAQGRHAEPCMVMCTENRCSYC